MRYWDSSALVALHIEHSKSTEIRKLFALGGPMVTWTLSDIELRSAVARLRRENALSREAANEVMTRFQAVWESLNVISSVEAVKLRAKRLLGMHTLKAADSLQLAAALTAVFDDPTGAQFVCLDRRLGEAAQLEGFEVKP